MNYTRLALTALVATVVDGLFGFIVYGNLLTGEFGRYPAIFRAPDAQAPYMPVLFAGLLLAMCAVTYIYAKGYEGGSGIQEGIRFGLLVGLFVVGYMALVSYATMNVGRRLTGLMALASLVEWVVVGAAIGAVYSRTPVARPRVRAGV